MAELTSLLEVRKDIKQRKPVFIRQDNPKRGKLNNKWRKPKGIHSKIRHKFKGRRKMPSPGYKSPAKVKGLHATGLKIISVFSAKDVQKIKKETEGIIVAKTVGMKKQLEIFKAAKQANLTILNINVDEKIKKIEDKINSKKKKEAQKEKPKEDKKEQQKEESKEMTDEEKKEAEKKEKDKLLTKRT